MRLVKQLLSKNKPGARRLRNIFELNDHVFVRNIKTHTIYAIRSTLADYEKTGDDDFLICIDVEKGVINTKKCFYFKKNELLTI